MADEKFLTYKGKPLVRKGNEIYYGDMNDKHVVRFEILSTSEKNNIEIADKVLVELLLSDTEIPKKDRVVKSSERDSLFSALDLGFTWLERA
ncbi:MAG: hypothetical protein J5766_02260 [Clostridia bacterium]|nr:hypothetical protein [Clostridia bacterium]